MQLGALPLAARGTVARTLGGVDDRFHAVRRGGVAILAAKPAGVHARFSRRSAVVRASGVSWSLGLRALGRGEHVVPVRRPRPIAHANRVRFDYGRVQEWYVSGPLGVEQGFTLRAPPSRQGTHGAVTLDLGRLPAGVLGRIRSGGRSLVLERGRRALVRYSGLSAQDARGRTLPAHIELSGRRLSLRVNDGEAIYPVRVDPFVAAGTLTASDGAAHDNLGQSVAVSGDTIAVGAPSATVNDHSVAGAVYVFVKQGASWASPQMAKLTASDGANFDSLGSSVAISGDTIAAGAPNGFQSVSGSVYVFVKPQGGWANGSETAKLTPSDGSGFDKFGWAVATDGNFVAAGMPGRQTNTGGVYVFTKPAGGWSSGHETAKLTASDGAAGDNLGNSVGVADGTIVGGAPFATVSGHAAQGAAYAFERSGATWTTSTQTAKLTASDGVAQDDLGYSVATTGDTIAAGARFATSSGHTGQGAIYVYVRPLGGWANGTQTARLTSSDGGSNDNLGWSTAMSGDTIAAGAPSAAVSGHAGQGAVYVFAKPQAGWADGSEAAKLTAGDGAGGDQFGYSAGLSGDAVTGGAPFADTAGHSDQGAAYAFTGSVGGVTPAATTTNLSCQPAALAVGQATTCTTTVSNAGVGGTTPTGTVNVSSNSSGSLGSNGACTLAPTATVGVAKCSLTYTPNSVGSGTHALTATYAGDGSHSASQGQANVSVTAAAGGGVPAPQTLTAALNVEPAPTCVGSVTRFDATGSGGPSPIVSYRLMYTDPTLKSTGFGFTEPDFDHLKTVTISDGPAADVTWVFPWNRAELHGGPVFNEETIYIRDPVVVQLTITDTHGATAQVSKPVSFRDVQLAADAPRSPDCPPFAPHIPAYPFPLAHVTVSPRVAPSGPILVTVPCRSIYLCSGLLTISPLASGVTGSARRRTPKPIAAAPFEIAPNKKATVKARLSSAGKRLLRRRKKLRVKVKLSYIALDRPAVSRSKSATIALKRSKHRARRGSTSAHSQGF
jgi:hypothetical protein